MQRSEEKLADAPGDQSQTRGSGGVGMMRGAGGPIAQGAGRCAGRARRPRPWQVRHGVCCGAGWGECQRGEASRFMGLSAGCE